MQEQLPDFVLADLFPSHLVLINSGNTMSLKSAAAAVSDSSHPPITSIEQPAFPIEKPIAKEKIKTLSDAPLVSIAQPLERPDKWYLGNNGKNCTILVFEPNAAFLNEDHLEFLTKILGACKLNMGDVAVINMSRYPANFSEIKKELNPTTCLLFDVTTSSIQLPFMIPPYQVQQFDGCKFLIAPSLAKYCGDSGASKLEKTKLWVSLKSLFNLL